MKLLAGIITFSLLLLQSSGVVTAVDVPATTLPSVAITQIQTNGYGTGTTEEEYISITNIGSDTVDISGWCIRYSSSTQNITNASKLLGCVDDKNELGDSIQVLLASNELLSFATEKFLSKHQGFNSDYLIVSAMAANDGHVALFNSQGEEVDRVGWGNALFPASEGRSAHNPVKGLLLSQDLSNIQDTNNNEIDFSYNLLFGVQDVDAPICEDKSSESIGYFLAPDGYLPDDNLECQLDFCPNIEHLQVEAPIGFEKKQGKSICTEIILEDSVILITEIYPNAPGSDKGQEFIELYNPNSTEISLAGYELQVGPSFTKIFKFDIQKIGAKSYKAFSDIETGIVLPNTNGVQLRLIAPAMNKVAQTNSYSSADDKESWALVEDQWIYTNQITPGAVNKPFLEPAVEEVEGVTSVLAPCPAGKFRNPETNRCKNIATAASILSPCDSDEFRNPETNRCKKITSSSSTLTPCAEGQERNPETNRCRKVSVLSAESELSDVTDVAVSSTEGDLNWPIIIAVISGTLGYMVYEWRFELSHRLNRIKQRV